MNVVPVDQLLPYSSRGVAVAFAYAGKLRKKCQPMGGHMPATNDTTDLFFAQLSLPLFPVHGSQL
jgi:hypothetical protein